MAKSLRGGFQAWSMVPVLAALTLTGCGSADMGGGDNGAGGQAGAATSNPGVGGGGGGAVSGGAGGALAGAAGGNRGAGGAAGASVDAGTPNMPPVSLPVPGVSTGGMCFPLCVTSAATQGDYGYENGASCVVAGSYTAQISQSCIVGAALPPPGHPAGSPGVVVTDACVALCDPIVVDTDPVDGWGWEFESACIIPGGSVAKTSLTCTTGSPITGSTAGAAGRLLSEACVRLCTVVTSDPTGAGFGFEFGASCVIPGTAAAMKGIDCKVGVPEPTGPPITLNPTPPAGQVRKPSAMLTRGFFVTGGRLYDKFGNDFVPRGLNNPDIWFDISDQYWAYDALDNIAAYGANTVRIIWNTAAPGTPALLRRIIRHVVELKMVPMIELHDYTGATSNDNLLAAASYYGSAPVKQVLLDFEEFLLINIANEWSGNDFMGGYQAAVSQLRASGINHTLIIDANGFGQNASSISSNGTALLAADSQHNLAFSVHMYDAFSGSGGRAKITSTLQGAVTMQLPLIVGEFGWQAGNPIVPVDAAFIMSECVRLKLGYLGWSWKGNDASLSYLDLAVDWEGAQLSSWGNTLIKGTDGLMSSSTKATIYTE
jgi:mannan endo-1,4-beta-mannosidase